MHAHVITVKMIIWGFIGNFIPSCDLSLDVSLTCGLNFRLMDRSYLEFWFQFSTEQHYKTSHDVTMRLKTGQYMSIYESIWLQLVGKLLLNWSIHLNLLFKDFISCLQLLPWDDLLVLSVRTRHLKTSHFIGYNVIVAALLLHFHVFLTQTSVTLNCKRSLLCNWKVMCSVSVCMKARLPPCAVLCYLQAGVELPAGPR